VDISRRIETEWLDHLAPDDPRAQHSRRDLQRINAMMGNASIVRREIGRALHGQSPGTIAEIGAGDGAFMLCVAGRRSTHWKNVQVLLVDGHAAVRNETLLRFESVGWKAEPIMADAAAWLDEPAGRVFDVMVANLVLHHFDTAALTTLLALAAKRTRLFVACEPRRNRFALAASHLLGLVGCNDVTRHDAVISVRAGFAGRELSALWPGSGDWELREGGRGLFGHCFVARARHANRIPLGRADR
jgi:hypothetical protein